MTPPLTIHIPLADVIEMMRRAVAIRLEREHPEAIGRKFTWSTTAEGVVLTEIEEAGR